MNRLNDQIFKSLNAGAVFLDQDFRLVEYNSVGISALGADDRLDLTGSHIFEISDRYADDLKVGLQSVLAGEKCKNLWSCPVECADDGKKGFWDYTISQYDDGILLTAFDASERVKKDEQDIELAANKIRRLEFKVGEYARLKADFVGNVSHELRTPLTSIIGFAQIMKNALDNRQSPALNVREGLEKILRNARHLLEMVEDVLTLSKIESGYLNIKYENFRLPALVREAVVNVESSAIAKGLSLQLKTASNEFPPVKSDPHWVYHIIRSLISNAVKFTKSGSISVTLDNFNELHWQLAIVDTGIGIEEKNFRRIFENFQQADMSLTRDEGGFGIGLSLSKLLAQKLGGVITLASEYGKGSTFTLRMPYNSPSIETADSQGYRQSQDLQ